MGLKCGAKQRGIKSVFRLADIENVHPTIYIK